MVSSRVTKSSLLVVLSAILYGFLGYLGTQVLRENFTISAMLFWRFFIAGIWMLLFVLPKYFQLKIMKIDPKTLASMFFLGALGYAGSSLLYFAASQYIGTGLAMVVFFSYPIMIALASWLFSRRQLNLATWLILALMLIGLVLLQKSSTYSVNLAGLAFGLGAAGCYAYYVASSKHLSIKMNSNLLTMLVCFGSAIIFFFYASATQSLTVPHSGKNWFYLLSLGVLATALPIQLMLEGLKNISSIKASIISVVEPLITVIVGVITLNESISSLQALGGLLILISALLIQFQRI
jgi:drug/metabolite transporter (DMT)-like permease